MRFSRDGAEPRTKFFLCATAQANYSHMDIVQRADEKRGRGWLEQHNIHYFFLPQKIVSEVRQKSNLVCHPQFPNLSHAILNLSILFSIEPRVSFSAALDPPIMPLFFLPWQLNIPL